jgi:uncharacterized membrane protein
VSARRASPEAQQTPGVARLSAGSENAAVRECRLFLLIRKMTTDKVLAALRGEGGPVMRSSFDESKEEALQAGLAGARAASVEARG